MASDDTAPELQQETGLFADARRSERIRRRLGIVRRVALVDLVLLIALVSSSLADRREFVQILGPLHGVNFLLLLVVAATAALDGLWGWWFPLVILISAGPPGAFVGEWAIARGIATRDNAGTTAGVEERGGATPASGAIIRQGPRSEDGPGGRGGREGRG